jgi:hypothetical protein
MDVKVKFTFWRNFSWPHRGDLVCVHVIGPMNFKSAFVANSNHERLQSQLPLNIQVKMELDKNAELCNDRYYRGILL